MISIYVHGPQANLAEWPLKCATNSIQEALNSLRQVKGFGPVPGQHQIAYQIVGRDTFDLLMAPVLGDEELHLVPAMIGGGGKAGGIGAVLLGVALVVVAVAAPEFLLGIGLTQGMISGMFAFGLSLALSGLLSFLATPTADTAGTLAEDAADPGASRYLGSPKNTVKIGTRIPIPFGRVKISGHILSINISSSFGTDTPYLSNVTEPGTTPSPSQASRMTPSAVYP